MKAISKHSAASRLGLFRLNSSRLNSVFLSVAIVFGLGTLGASIVHAEDAKCEVLEIKASTGEAKADPALKSIAKKLAKPPFSAWTRFAVLKKHSFNAPHLKEAKAALVSGGNLSLLFKERSDAKGHKPRLNLEVSLFGKDKKRQAGMRLKVDSGDTTLVGRDQMKDGSSHILAIRCNLP